MKTKINFNAVVLLLFFLCYMAGNVAAGTISVSEPGNLTGKISDETSKKPMEYVTVVLYSFKDSSMVAGTISNSEGNFTISVPDSGKYYLDISYLGFEKKRIQPIVLTEKSNKINLGEIFLSPSTEDINEIIVTGTRSAIEYKVDKRVINVDKNITAQGGTAVQALENTPSVQVDAQRNLTLRGSSDYLVLIDGKPSVLKGSEALKQLPSSAIKQIEVITNPSAKYDADGNAGIINVILKKEKLQGLSGSVNLSAGVPDKNNSNAILSYRKGKLNYFAGVDYADNRYTTKITIDNITFKTTGNQFIDEVAKQFSDNNNLSFKGGIDFDPNEKNSFSVSGSIGRQGYDSGTDAKYHIWENETLNNYNTSSNFMDVTGDVLTFTTDYRYKFSDEQILSFTNYYNQWDGVDDNMLEEYNSDDFFNPESISSMLNFTKNNFNYQYRSNLDYSMPVKNGKFEAGVQFRYENRKEDLLFRNYNVTSGNWHENNQFSYKQKYNNSIYSGYAIWSGKAYGVNYQVGLRSEYFTRTNDLSNSEELSVYNKFMLYPSVHLSKDIKENQMLQLNYSRRINRPQPYLLNNTPSYVDPYNIFKGSPDLKFEFSDNFEFNYRTIINKLTLSTQTYFRNTTNSFSAVRLLNEEGVMIHQLTNSKNQVAFGIEQEVDYKLFKWWQLNGNINVYNYTLKTLVSETEKKQKVNTWDARLVSSFNFKTNTRFQVIGYYRAPGVDAMGETTGFAVCNLAVNQVFLKGKITAGISANNIFNSVVFDYSVETDQYDNNYRIQSESPFVMANLSLNLNNFRNKKRGSDDAASFKGGGAF